MRFSWLACLTGSLALLSAAFLLGGGPSFSIVNAQEAAKSDEKKDAAKKPADKKASVKIDALDEQILRRAKVPDDADALLAFLKGRVLTAKERPEFERMVRDLGSSNFRVREKAIIQLHKRGHAALVVLQASLPAAANIEARRRIERTIADIRDNDVGPAAPAAAVRVIALRNPDTLVEALLIYLPHADNDAVVDEIRVALRTHALKDGKANPALVAALSDGAAIRRATAGEVLARTAHAGNKEALRKLLSDPDGMVRYRVAHAMVLAKDAAAVPTLIDAIPDMPINTAWQAEDFLLHLAGAIQPPAAAMGNSKDAREKCKAGWHEWWKKHGDKVDLARAEDMPRMLGRTLIVLLDQNTVLELGPDNVPRFEIKGLILPLDVQMLDEDRLLIAEHGANRVTERNLRGEVLWTKAINGGRFDAGLGGPQVAQRLPNGNTFIATAFKLLEYDKDGNQVVDVSLADDGIQKIMKAMKLDNGEIVCMQADGLIVRYDARGNELHRFQIQIGMRLFGGRVHMLPNGRIIVPHNAENKVVEYDSRGKVVWEVPFEQPVAATRLPNGNTLITSMDPFIGAVEVDRVGTRVWSYQHASNSRVTRAIRR